MIRRRMLLRSRSIDRSSSSLNLFKICYHVECYLGLYGRSSSSLILEGNRLNVEYGIAYQDRSTLFTNIDYRNHFLMKEFEFGTELVKNYF